MLSLTLSRDTLAASSARWSWLPIIRVTRAGSPRCRYLAAAMRPASVRDRRNASPARNRARAIAASARVARGAESLGERLGIGVAGGTLRGERGFVNRACMHDALGAAQGAPGHASWPGIA